jgi:predicted dehydrogenase
MAKQDKVANEEKGDLLHLEGTMSKILRVGIIGMGGFAGVHHDHVKQLEAEGECQLVCTCDPDVTAFSRRMEQWEFGARGVMVFDHYLDMLDACADQLDVVAIPTPVPLHAEMHRAVVERGPAAYLEKPPTLNYAELDKMLNVEARARRQTNVGFVYIDEPERQALKQRMLQGEFGAVRQVCFTGIWPRATSYFQRARWAGRLMLDGRLVLDSCLGNAMAHYAHNVLFWAGLNSLFNWAEVTDVQAELYRAHAIEGTDTVFARARTANGIDLQLALTHACAGEQWHREWIVCDKATVSYVTNQSYTIAWNGGPSETHALPPVSLRHNLSAYYRYLRGETGRPTTRLIDARPFVELNDLVYLAAGSIVTVAPEHITRTPAPDGLAEWVAINGIESVVERFFVNGEFPSQQNLPWARAGGSATRDNLPQLFTAITQMAQP